ncbi:hypothetical protein BKA64DRAFT_686831 [Cadophora sp. MPI-SDFR-AT-0126]|nr:hypothetical protein BKA64DRAFT_686831 [Leotiomycetes sp. MPI-SDFR-AT-0126]
MNLLISLSLLSFFTVRLYSQQLAENFLTTSNYFHALEIATFAFKPYTYVLTAPRSKSTATRCKLAPEQLSIPNKLQQIRSSGVSLSTPGPAVALAANNGGYRTGIRGTGTIYSRSDKANNDETDDD